MDVFKFDNYKEVINFYIKSLPKKGHGEISKIAKHLGITTVSVSQVFRGSKNLSLEQTIILSEYLGFNKLQTDYFFNLVLLERSGHFKLKKNIELKLIDIKERSENLKERMPQSKEISEADKSKLYSQWYYIGILLLVTIDGLDNINALENHLKLSREKIYEAVHFLVEKNLLLNENGALKSGLSQSHLESGHPLVSLHHLNWRLKSIEKLNFISQKELFYTGPVTVDEKSFAEFKTQLLNLIQEYSKAIQKGKSEKLACLNVDWFFV